MVNTLLIIWSVLATVTVFIVGLILAFSPHGDTWPGITIAALAVGLGAGCVQLCREQWGIRRREHLRSTVSAEHYAQPGRADKRPSEARKRRQQLEVVQPHAATRPQGRTAPAGRRVAVA